jgi:RND family efflux transporter MFP subunit
MRFKPLAVVTITSLALFAGCGGEEEAPEKAPVARPIKILTVGDAGEREFTLPGRVAAGEQVDLAFRVGGPLIELPAQEGQEVRKGQIVATIDPRDFRIRVDSAQATFDQAEADIERLSALYEKDAASQAQLDQARATRGVAKASLDDARANLSDTKLRAPFTANVGEVFAENFQDVRAKQPILSLVGIGTLEIQVDLPESIIARLRTENADRREVFARFEVNPDVEYPLELTELASQADPATGTYQATLVMPQPDGINILPGMTAEVVGHARGDSVAGAASIVVPAISVAADESGVSYVWVVSPDDMTVHKRPVTTGELVGADEIEIADGIAAGEMIAVSAISRLREDMPVRKLDE